MQRSLSRNFRWPSPEVEEEDKEDEAVVADDPSERLQEHVQYLRMQHLYCFWCGCSYRSSQELCELCPGIEEDAH